MNNNRCFLKSVDMEPTHSSPPPTSVSSPTQIHHDERGRPMSSPTSSNNNTGEVGQDLTSRNEVNIYFHFLSGEISTK